MMWVAAIFLRVVLIAGLGWLGQATPQEQAMAGDSTQQPPEGLIASLNHHVPDPSLAKIQAQQELEKTTRPIDAVPLENLIKRISMVERPVKIHLTLEDALRRTLENNFAIRVSSYNPAIETTRVVEAEAAFDAVYFTNVSNAKINQPAPSAISGSNIQDFTAEAGIRKLLPSGMQVQTSYETERQFNDFAFQTINPTWTGTFIVQFQQPLLRGFGIDFNRSQIRLQKLSREQSMWQFKRQVRDTLRSAEEAYWRIVQARRNLVVAAKLLASFEQIYNFLEERKEFDVYRIQLADTRARLEQARAAFVQSLSNIRDAEDNLIAIMNDPAINLADEKEIVPDTDPALRRVLVDRLAEVQTALDHRSEIAEAKIGIKTAKIQVGVAKNQTMPQLDLTFRYEVAGLGRSSDDAFDQVTMNDFHRYTVGVQFELPVGNRARRAALRRAILQHAQSIAGLKQTIEQIILDVNVAVRAVQVNYDLIEPNLQSADATEDQVASIIARAEKKDFLTLNTELNARQSLAQNRSALLSSLVDYNIAIIDLERAKGTLLRYDNVDLVIGDVEPAE